jgi:hypothetical protein
VQTGVEADTCSPDAPASPAEASVEPPDPAGSAESAESADPVASDVPVPLPAAVPAAAGEDATVVVADGADVDSVSASLWQAVRDRARAVPATASSAER